MQDHERILESFRRALSELSASSDVSRLRPRSVALRAHAIYLRSLPPEEKRPSSETFRKFASGCSGSDAIVRLLDDAGIRSARRSNLDRDRVKLAFREAVLSLEDDIARGNAKPLHIAGKAREIYNRASDGKSPTPSIHTFEYLVYGKTADPEVLAILEAGPKRRDRELVVEAFARALKSLNEEGRKNLRPRSVAVRAHSIHAAALSAEDKRPSVETFRKFASGPRALPEVARLLEEAKVKTTERASLNRERVRAVFREAVQRLEARLFKGQASSSRIARRAYEIYTRQSEGGSSNKPSPRTFESLIYGKVADPEIAELVRTALKGRG